MLHVFSLKAYPRIVVLNKYLVAQTGIEAAGNKQVSLGTVWDLQVQSFTSLESSRIQVSMTKGMHVYT